MELFEAVYSILIGLPIYIALFIFAFIGTLYFILITVFQISCLVYAPVAGIIFAMRVDSHRIGRRRCLLVGATYSALLLLPWIYLLRSTINPRFPFHSITSTYRWIYVLWLGTIASSPAPIIAVGFLNASGRTPSWALILAPILVAVTIWRISTRHLSRVSFDESEQMQDKTNNSQLEVIPDHKYILPFASISATIVCIPLTWILLTIGFHLLYR